MKEGYDGNLVDGKRHGQGTFTYSNGDKFEGEWKNDEEHQGTVTYADGDKYVGELKDGGRHGRGTFTNPSGSKYVGEWKNDVRHGQGTMTYSSGAKYVGEWEYGKKHGQGTYTWDGGKKYEGEWKDDMMHGQGTFTFADGRKHVGEWKDGEIIKKNEDDDEENQVEEDDDDNFAPTKNEEQVGIFKKKIPDRYSLESSLATLIDNIDHEMFTNPKSYIVMRKDYTFSCVVAVRAGDVDDDEAILEKVRIRALEPWYTNLALQKGAGTSLQDPGLHMLTDGFARHSVGILLEKL